MHKIIIILVLVSGIARANDLSATLQTAGENAGEIQAFVQAAEAKHGDFGKQAAHFLVQGMPPQDLQKLKKDFLLNNLSLAIKAKESFPWARSVPDEVFLNDVLPYASLDETRESWRSEIYEQVAKLVTDCQTTTEAAQAINKQFFNVINVHYNTGRKRPNQSPAESKELGMATCTGLSIILVDACRAVGVPARVAGTPLWTNKRGNHTWVEIWDSGEWYFTGADEYDSKGLNRGWFTGDASKAQADDWKHAIWATSWQKTDHHFPMVWNRWSKNVSAVNVTARYAREQKPTSDRVATYFRVFEKSGGKRLVVSLEVLDQAGTVLGTAKTKAGYTDLNDMPAVALAKNQTLKAKLSHGDESRTATFKTTANPEQTIQWNWDELQQVALKDQAAKPNKVGNMKAIRSWLKQPVEKRQTSIPKLSLSRAEATKVAKLLYARLLKEQEETRQQELDAHVVKAAGKEMKYLEKEFGKAREGQRSLWISMHGGGGAPARVNDQQWNNQIRLYQPAEGIMVAPRAPTDTWNLWHQSHIDSLFDRLIENFVALRGVNPNRIYLMGYSAGGDGVYQLAPRMADRFAAASMMAGHPNDASPLGLRNLPFMIFMGGKDAAYKRNQIAAEWGEKLKSLQEADQQGYEHKVTIYENYGHWMQGEDAEALPWMIKRSRNAWPQKIVWRQSPRTHERFYWLAVPKAFANGGQVIRAEVNQQRIDIQTEGEINQLTLRLNDQLLDLDQPVEVVVNGKTLFSGEVERSVQAIQLSLSQRLDPASVASSLVTVSW